MIFGQKIYCLMSKNVVKISINSSAKNYNTLIFNWIPAFAKILNKIIKTAIFLSINPVSFNDFVIKGDIKFWVGFS